MDFKAVEEKLKDGNQPKFRLSQIRKALFQDGVSTFAEISTLPKELREHLDREIKILSFSVEKVLKSIDRRSLKALLRLDDGNLMETVLISPKEETWSACVSSQVGCPMGCGFCATGKSGFKRNLTAEEITDQVLFWRQYLRKNRMKGLFSNIVYMGMGEPFLNWEEVEKSLKDLIDPKLFGFGSRSISVSTAGIPEGINNLAKIFPQVNLAISLHFAGDKTRSKFMPINDKYNLNDLREAIKDYFGKARRKIFLEYILLAGINDSPEDARELADFIKSVGNANLLHVNLIRYNQTSRDLLPSLTPQVQKFKECLSKNRINVTIRKSLGEDIQGACGQLAGRLDSRR
jgi:23S rRNA (adenine(2503)-C(2))-methyltransferase